MLGSEHIFRRLSDDVNANVEINVSGELSNCWADSSKRTRKMSVSVIVHVLPADECVSRTAACSGTTVLARTFVIEFFIFGRSVCVRSSIFGCRRPCIFDFWQKKKYFSLGFVSATEFWATYTQRS